MLQAVKNRHNVGSESRQGVMAVQIRATCIASICKSLVLFGNKAMAVTTNTRQRRRQGLGKGQAVKKEGVLAKVGQRKHVARKEGSRRSRHSA